jgi:hypothetical protein
LSVILGADFEELDGYVDEDGSEKEAAKPASASTLWRLIGLLPKELLKGVQGPTITPRQLSIGGKQKSLKPAKGKRINESF